MIELAGVKYYTAQEVAEKLNLSLGRIAQLRKAGKLKFIQISERKFLYTEQALKDYILFSAF